MEIRAACRRIEEYPWSIDNRPAAGGSVWQEVKMGLFSARSNLQLVDEKTGQAGVLESKLAKTEN